VARAVPASIVDAPDEAQHLIVD